MRALIIKIIIRLTALFPLRVSQAIGAAAGRAMLIIPNRPRLIAQKNISMCFPEFTAQQQNALLAKTLEETGKTAMEMGALWFWRKNHFLRLLRDISGAAHVTDSLNQRGVILLAPHLGSWEFSGLYTCLMAPITSLYRPPRMQGLDTFIHRARQRFGASLVPTDTKGVRSLYAALNAKKMVGILPDQDAGRSGNVFAPFFGITASTMTLLSRLARKTGAAVIITYAERLPHGQGFHLHFLPTTEDIAHKDPVVAATALNTAIEQCVRATPEQYQWVYKRFKTRPQGENKLY